MTLFSVSLEETLIALPSLEGLFVPMAAFCRLSRSIFSSPAPSPAAPVFVSKLRCAKWILTLEYCVWDYLKQIFFQEIKIFWKWTPLKRALADVLSHDEIYKHGWGSPEASVRMCWAMPAARSQPSPLQSGMDLQVAKHSLKSLVKHLFCCITTFWVYALYIFFSLLKKKKRER